MISEIAKPNYGDGGLTQSPALCESCCHTQAQKPFLLCSNRDFSFFVCFIYCEDN